jgi:nucleoside-diphosphate kinase
MHRDLDFYEKTFVMIKPDGVQRGLIGEILNRFEKKGLKLVALKMVWPTKEQAAEHYFWPEEDKIKLGKRTKESNAKRGIEDDRDPIEIANWVHGTLIEGLTAGPVITMVVSGAHAISHVRKMRGSTNPSDADIGSISGDYTIDSYQLADWGQRSIRNLVHASGSVEEAEREMMVWFSEQEILDYDLAIEQILYTKEWEKLNADKNPHK